LLPASEESDGTLVSEDAPGTLVSEDAPGTLVSEDAPGTLVSEDAPGTLVSEDAPGTPSDGAPTTWRVFSELDPNSIWRKRRIEVPLVSSSCVKYASVSTALVSFSWSAGLSADLVRSMMACSSSTLMSCRFDGDADDRCFDFFCLR
jgi:hypothetical protein